MIFIAGAALTRVGDNPVRICILTAAAAVVFGISSARAAEDRVVGSNFTVSASPAGMVWEAWFFDQGVAMPFPRSRPPYPANVFQYWNYPGNKTQYVQVQLWTTATATVTMNSDVQLMIVEFRRNALGQEVITFGNFAEYRKGDTIEFIGPRENNLRRVAVIFDGEDVGFVDMWRH